MVGSGPKRSRKANKAGGKAEADRRRRLMVVTIADRLDSPYLANLANRLIAEHAASGLSKPEFAEFVGMSGSQFRYVRRRLGNPSITMLAEISKKLRVPLYELLEAKPVRDRKNPSGAKMVETIGAVVNERFRNSGLTKQEFAKFLNVSLPQLYLITDGVSNPSLLVLVELAERLDISLWELLGVESARKPASGANRAAKPKTSRVARLPAQRGA
ncbi:helix-turn-helix domain-containing protein (plasmid) [Methylocystis rosea]|uniref:Helix-turn-helix domain-containing protein n=3 Tax=Alphaproteobacteria TaxID=28211 RepID=A0ABX6EMG0_9HYPH|nr:helix-turn-helix domain-containing protein [Methylocystis rosea]